MHNVMVMSAIATSQTHDENEGKKVQNEGASLFYLIGQTVMDVIKTETLPTTLPL